MASTSPRSSSRSIARSPRLRIRRPATFTTQHGGRYKMRATIVDAKGRNNRTEQDFWVSGGEQIPARDVSQEQVTIIPDRKEYVPGTTAELLIQSPFYPAEGVVSWRRSGIVKTERISIAKPTTVITVPIADTMVPNLTVQVDLVGAAPRLDDHGHPDPKLPKRPAYAVGSVSLSVPPKQRTLHVTVSPSAAKVGPGDKATLAIGVEDAAGKPVADAEVAVFVVDEAVLALSGYQFANPIETFYRSRDTDTRDVYARAYLLLAKPDTQSFGNGRSGFGPGGGGSGFGTIGTGRYGTIGHGGGRGGYSGASRRLGSTTSRRPNSRRTSDHPNPRSRNR